MKTIKISISYIAAVCIMVAAVFKFNHLPGAGALLGINGLLLSIYFPLFIIDKMGEKTDGRILPSHIAAALSASLIDLGITFKLWFWDGASILLISGLVTFSLVFIPMLLIQKSKQPNPDNFMNAAGAFGISTFALGILFKLQHFPFADIIMATGPAFLFLIYFPRYIFSKTISAEIKKNYLRNTFFVIVIGTLVSLYFMKSIELHATESKSEIRTNN
jgi:hypothetical protein